MIRTMTQEKPPRSKSQGDSSALLPGSASAFEHLAAAIHVLSEAVPARMSVRQVLAFAIIAHANTMGRHITLSEVREIAGDALGQSIERTIQAFFNPTKREPDAL